MSKATDDISSQIGSMGKASGRAVKAVETIVAVVKNFGDIAAGISSAVE